MKTSLLLAAGIIAAALPALALATDVTVSQSDKQFDTAAIDVRVGDRIAFRNDDKVSHNVHSSTTRHRFNLGLQKPGEAAVLEVTDAGSFEVRCAIHPKMKLTVTAR